MTISAPSANTFFGVVSDDDITTVTVTAIQNPAETPTWPTVQDLTFGRNLKAASHSKAPVSKTGRNQN